MRLGLRKYQIQILFILFAKLRLAQDHDHTLATESEPVAYQSSKLFLSAARVQITRPLIDINDKLGDYAARTRTSTIVGCPFSPTFIWFDFTVQSICFDVVPSGIGILT